jgi:hypothetical protein
MSNVRIVAPQPDAIATGAIVLKVGSNAVDAAIACAFVQTVVERSYDDKRGFQPAAALEKAQPWLDCADRWPNL